MPTARPQNLFYLPCDIEQFFAAIDHQILLARLASAVRDEGLIWLCARILASGAGVLAGEHTPRHFPGDDLFSALRPRGLPIGNLTSQFWANVYLDPLDQFVKRRLGCRAYLRYVDDFVLFSNSKRELWEWRAQVTAKLAALRLTLHEGACQPRPVGEGVPFLGWIVRPGSLRLKRRKGIAYRRRLSQLLLRYEAGELTWHQLWASIRGWAAHAGSGDTEGLRRAVLAQVVLRPRRMPP